MVPHCRARPPSQLYLASVGLFDWQWKLTLEAVETEVVFAGCLHHLERMSFFYTNHALYHLRTV